jgi:hypothetical protein
MSKPYIIQPGDTLTQIAAREGFASWRDIYYDPENTSFRAKRPNPDRIFPGDVLIIPGKQEPPPVLEESTKFKMFLMKNFAWSRRPRAVIMFSNEEAMSSYIFKPDAFGQVLEQKLSADFNNHDNQKIDFETPQPMKPDAFEGPVWLSHFFGTQVGDIANFCMRGVDGSGKNHLICVKLVTDPASRHLTAPPGSMVLANRSNPILRKTPLAARSS